MKTSDLMTIRAYRDGDKNFILSTWLRGLKYGNDLFNEIPPHIYFKAYQSILLRLLDSPNVNIKVACLKDDADVILGYVVTDKAEEVLHWCFSKSAWRNIGVAKSLVPSTITTATHFTKVGLSLLRNQKNVIFNPFALT